MEVAKKFTQLYTQQSVRLNIKARIPSLQTQLVGKTKGSDGTVGVIGGSREYTGAPYFAGISALKSGCDLVHVFCHPEASTVIKGYAPELIVHPSLDAISDSDNDIEKSALAIASFFKRMDVLVIGPGLGRSPIQIKIVTKLIELAKKENLPLVIDADGLFILQGNIGLVQDYRNCVLTPNHREFKRLLEARNVPLDINAARLLSQSLGNVSILLKGMPDLIVRDKVVAECHSIGSARRVGGQGDIISGCLATFLCWSLAKSNRQLDDLEGPEKSLDPYLAASFAACESVKVAASKAFALNGRSMITSDIIDQIGPSFHELYEE